MNVEHWYVQATRQVLSVVCVHMRARVCPCWQQQRESAAAGVRACMELLADVHAAG